MKEGEVEEAEVMDVAVEGWVAAQGVVVVVAIKALVVGVGFVLFSASKLNACLGHGKKKSLQEYCF